MEKKNCPLIVGYTGHTKVNQENAQLLEKSARVLEEERDLAQGGRQKSDSDEKPVCRLQELNRIDFGTKATQNKVKSATSLEGSPGRRFSQVSVA